MRHETFHTVVPPPLPVETGFAPTKHNVQTRMMIPSSNTLLALPAKMRTLPSSGLLYVAKIIDDTTAGRSRRAVARARVSFKRLWAKGRRASAMSPPHGRLASISRQNSHLLRLQAITLLRLIPPRATCSLFQLFEHLFLFCLLFLVARHFLDLPRLVCWVIGVLCWQCILFPTSSDILRRKFIPSLS